MTATQQPHAQQEATHQPRQGAKATVPVVRLQQSLTILTTGTQFLIGFFLNGYVTVVVKTNCEHFSCII